MASEKVVTVTLPSGTRVSCREGLAARLAPKPSEPPAKKATSTRKRAAAKPDDD